MPNGQISIAYLTAAIPNRGLGVAVILSCVLHATAYFAMPRFVEQFTPAKVVRYDASLIPIERAIATVATPGAAVKRRVAARIDPPAVRPVSETNFAAPENAIAVAAADAVERTEPQAIQEPVPATNNLGTESQAATVAEAPTTVAPVTTPSPKRVAPAFAERISIEYKLTSSIADGVANFKWTRKGDAYEIESSTQATGFLIAALTGVIYQQSRGTITEDGLRPTVFSIRRGDGEAETAEFQRPTNSLLFKRGNNVRTVPMNREMQDMQSFLFQLAYDAPRIAEGDGRLDVLVTNARKVYRYQFKKISEEIVETRFGPVDTIRLLSEAANPEDAYEVWLAPKYSYLPVRLKLYLGRFPFEQIATRIGVAGAEYSATPKDFPPPSATRPPPLSE